MDVVIGQGFLQVTPLQLARLYMAIANEGTSTRSTWSVRSGRPLATWSSDIDQDRFQRIEAKPSTWRALKDGLRHVLQWQRGTAYRPSPERPYDPAGKTGSAQTATAAHGWFAGFAPAHDPEIVVVVFAEHGESGAATAPIAREIMDGYFGAHRRPDQDPEGRRMAPEVESQNDCDRCTNRVGG